MASNAVSGVGFQFRRWNTSLGQWVKLAELVSFTGPNKKRDTIDVTNLDSTEGYKEFIASFRDAGFAKFNMNFTRDGYDILDADFESDVKQNYEIVLPDPDHTSIEFVGLVDELGLAVSTDKAINSDVSIKISGPPTVNSGSGPNVS